MQIPSPCYVLNEKQFRQNLSKIQQVQEQSGASIILALKGFSMWKVFPIIKEYGIKTATASSLNEAMLTTDCFNAKAHTYSPVYSPTEIDEILACSSHITFNSLSQLERYKEKVLHHPSKISIGLRVNPEYSVVTTPLYDPCTPGSRLGVDMSKLKELPEGVEGLHFHNLCESNAIDLQKTIEKVESNLGGLLSKLKWMNFGGGHLMTRKDYDLNKLVQIIKTIKSKYDVDVYLEPGSAFGWDCGHLEATVLDIVENHNIATAILDVSFTAHMPDTLEMPYRPKVLEANENGKYKYRLGGTSCLAGDFYFEYSFNNALTVGDRLRFMDMMHYTMVKTTFFNGVKHPSIGMINTEEKFELFKSFGYEEYKNRLS